MKIKKIIKCRNCNQPINEQIESFVESNSSKGGKTTSERMGGSKYFSMIGKRGGSKKKSYPHSNNLLKK